MTDSVYLERYSYGPELIQAAPPPDLELVVVIPCYFEPDIISTLQSLADCDPVNGNVEVIIVMNHSSADSAEVIDHNYKTTAHINQWIKSQSNRRAFYVINQTLPAKHAGVGLARKIGMDEAVRRFHRLNKDGVIVCLDADCTCTPNYFQAITKHFKTHQHTPGCSIYFEHPLEGPLSLDNYRAIAAYELHLRYYTHALRFSGLPCAFQTVGSALAVRTSAYQKQGGMNKRKAGEDFHFLQKIIQLGGFTELKTTAVYPSARVSDRVPFGTGKAMLRQVNNKDVEFLTYHPNTFIDLKKLVTDASGFYGSNTSNLTKVWKSCSPAIQGYIEHDKFVELIQDLNRKTSSPDSFTKRFFQWFDGFRAFKFANYARENHYPAVKVAEAASWLLLEAYGVEPAADDVRALLMHYRELDRKQIL